MYNHADENNECPICIALEGTEDKRIWIVQNDIFYKDELVTGFISSKAIQGNEGHALVVPNGHHENFYDLPSKVGHHIIDVAKKVALAIKKTRSCDGVTILQNNEPAGDQHAFHYHMHIVPRFEGGSFHEELWKAKKSMPEDRKDFADKLRKQLQ